MLLRLASWLQQHLFPCVFKQCFGVDCPTCGMQRAFIELLKGDMSASLGYHWALIPTLLLFAFLFLHLIFPLKYGTVVIKALFAIDVATIVLNYIFN